MSSTDRHRGIQIHRGIIYGSHARLLTPEEKATAPPEHTHKWTIFIAPATSPPPRPGSLDEIDMDLIPGGADDLGYLFKRVTFKLHDTYHNPNRAVEKPPFQVTETGWGEFTVNARINFVPESGEKPMNLGIPIKLFHRGQPVEPPPSDDAAGEGQGIAGVKGQGETGAGAGAEGAGDSDERKDGDVSMAEPTLGAAAEASASASADMTPLPDSETAKPEATGTDAHADAQTPGTGTPAGDADPSSLPASASAAPTPAQQAHTARMAAKYPVHAWQYDELVFCDPYPAFYQLLVQNPPTPLPPKNRRARDQREEWERRDLPGGKKRRLGVARGSVGATGPSREGTATAEGEAGAEGQETKEKPGPPPAEDATADTPLEFSKEMEKGEWNVLNDARIKVVEEMDRWRERLIAQEKELFKIKEEMKAMS